MCARIRIPRHAQQKTIGLIRLYADENAARFRGPEGRAPQLLAAPTAATRSTFPGGPSTGTGLFAVPAASLPLPATSAASEGADFSRRGQTEIHGQAGTRPDWGGAEIRQEKTLV